MGLSPRLTFQLNTNCTGKSPDPFWIHKRRGPASLLRLVPCRGQGRSILGNMHSSGEVLAGSWGGGGEGEVHTDFFFAWGKGISSRRYAPLCLYPVKH